MLRETLRSTTSNRPKDAFGKGMRKPKADAPRVQSNIPGKSKLGKEVSSWAFVLALVIALWLLSQVGGCVASCGRSVGDAPGSGSSSASLPAETIDKESSPSDSHVAYIDDERTIAEVADAAASALKSLPTRSVFVDRVAAYLDDAAASQLGYTAGECGLDSHELARWLMGTATGTVDPEDLSVFDNGAARVYVQTRAIPAYAYVSNAYDIASVQAGWKDGTPEGKKRAIAFALEAAKASSPWSDPFIYFDMKNARAGWELDEQAFRSTLDHLYGLY